MRLNNGPKNAFSLQELVIAISIAGVVALFAIPLLFHTRGKQETLAKHQYAAEQVVSAMRHADTEIGLLPMSYGPSQVLEKFSNQAKPINTSSNTIGVCPTGQADGEKTYQLVDGIVITNVAPAWKEDAYGIANNAFETGDMVCLALKGQQSSTWGDSAHWVYLPRTKQYQGKNWQLASAAPPSVSAPSAPAPASSAPTPTGGNRISLLSVNNVDYGGYDTYLSRLNHHVDEWGGMWERIQDNLKGFLGSSFNATLDRNISQKAKEMLFFDSSGNEIAKIDSIDFFKGFTINGIAWSSYKSTLATRYGNHSDFYMMQLYSGDVLRAGGNAIDQDNWIYKDSATGKTYQISAGFFSPVKLGLFGQNAALNSDHHFKVALEGFNSDVASLNLSTPVEDNRTIALGGLNTGEAWLVADREGNGLMRDGVLDGTDLFGDHQGRFQTGYDDLAQRYAAFIQLDEDGKRYISLHIPSPVQEEMYQSLRKKGVTVAHPSLELKLMTRDGHVYPAYQYLTRIYVDYDHVFEQDAQQYNQIRQRAAVWYRNGQKASSADQWFKVLD